MAVYLPSTQHFEADVRKRILVLMGTRPEAIKLAPVVDALRAANQFDATVVNTGQHRELLDQVVQRFNIRVDHNLAVMQSDQSLASLTAKLVQAIDDVLVTASPAFVVVQGDTTTVLAGALASFYRRVPLGHVEAGLRTDNLTSPFPEEANRRLTTTLAALHFAPTQHSAQNLLSDGVAPDRVLVTGNTVIDALHAEVGRQQAGGQLSRVFAELGVTENGYVLITGHRRENFGRGFEQVCDALTDLATRFAHLKWVFPVHLNPRVRGVVHDRLAGVPNILLIPPQPYDRFVALLSGCRMVLTDSGGVQEEAPGLGKPVLVMRATTERPEGVSAGVVKLVGTDAAAITRQTSTLLSDPKAYAAMAGAVNPYGDGRAAGRIVAAVSEFLDQRSS